MYLVSLKFLGFTAKGRATIRCIKEEKILKTLRALQFHSLPVILCYLNREKLCTGRPAGTVKIITYICKFFCWKTFVSSSLRGQRRGVGRPYKITYNDVI